ncbi:MAG: type II secretion system F family protein [Candidatus Omnitrophica bacterium]|nr:type II secretion system F family protein [Candidatus Omnitrophota bacterium]
MPHYKYRAKKGPDDISEGFIEAASEREAIEKINQMGLAPLGIEQAAIEKTQKKRPSRSFVSGRIKSHDITIFSRQLSSFMKSGIPILRSLSILSEQSSNTRLKSMFEDIRQDVKDGQPLSQALSRFPKIFNALYIAMVRTGEESGTLAEVFARMADYRQKQEDVISKVRMALLYPILMAFVALGTIVFMLIFVLPRLTRIFSTLGEDLPTATQILITISSGMRTWWYWIVLAIVLLFLVFWRQSKTKAGARTLSTLKLRLPILGNLSLKSELSTFSRTLELLIKNGIPVLKAIEITVPTINNEIIRQEVRRSCKDLEQGASFGKSLKSSKVFPAFMVNLLIIGEESGRLEEALSEIVASYEKETEEAVQVMTTLLEPLVILFMGVVVGFIVIAMLLPVFQINVMVR